MLDMSYLLNESLWGPYFFSTITETPDLEQALVNTRLRYSEDAYEAAEVASEALEDFDTSAIFLENHGALNVNSTSVEAWKALLTAFRDLRLGDNPAETVPVSRTLDPIGAAIEFAFDEGAGSLTTNIDEDQIGAVSSRKDYSDIINGIRYLTDGMIQVLAERIVDEVRLRGPFYSVADL